MRSHRVGQGGVGAAAGLSAPQSWGNVVSYRKEVKPMRTRYWVALAALAVLLTATLAGDALAQSTGRGYLAYSGDYDVWTIRVTPGYWYTVWMRADDSWVDFDLVGVCSSTSSGPYEACSFFAFDSTYYIRVVSARGFGWYTIGIH